MNSPLADVMRPQTLDEVVGQRHLLSKNSVLRKAVDSGRVPNMIFYGPSGVGKTTVARIIAKTAGKKLCRLNGTTATTADLRAVSEATDTIDGRGGVVLYLDEIQYLNKKQQQSLLEFIEDGSITLIASTTENPHFYVYNAVLSRCTVFEFKPLDPSDVKIAVERAFEKSEEFYGVKPRPDAGVSDAISRATGGDVRKALNIAEMLMLSAVSSENPVLTLEDVAQLTGRTANRYDRDGDEHYDILSALQKSVRGSDENAALHYLARLLEAGDLISACRRLIVMASEDIGPAYPMAAVIAESCVAGAFRLGMPEAVMPLSNLVVILCTAPKSNSASSAYSAAAADVKNGGFGDVPAHLRDSHYGGAEKLGRGKEYLYPHNYPGNYVAQQYLPDAIKDKVYYTFGKNKTEQAAKVYRDAVLGRTRDPEKK